MRKVRMNRQEMKVCSRSRGLITERCSVSICWPADGAWCVSLVRDNRSTRHGESEGKGQRCIEQSSRTYLAECSKIISA